MFGCGIALWMHSSKPTRAASPLGVTTLTAFYNDDARVPVITRKPREKLGFVS